MPLDFSGKSRQALDFAVPLAEQYGGKIFLIHVIEPVYSVLPGAGEMGIAAVNPDLMLKPRRKRLSAAARELVPRELLGKTLIRTGRAHLEIVDAAKDLRADLVVIATHGFTGLKHMLLGSTAEQVVRHAPCPVLAVRQH